MSNNNPMKSSISTMYGQNIKASNQEDSQETKAKDTYNTNQSGCHESTNPKLKIKLKKNVKKHSPEKAPSWITVPNNIDYQCPYCLRLFHTEGKMTKHIEKCAQLRSQSTVNSKSIKNTPPVKNPQEPDKELNNEVDILSSIYSKRKSYIKALKSLKEDEDIIKKDKPQKLVKESNTRDVTHQENPQETYEYSEKDNGLNEILTCFECKYVTYRKWDLDRHFNEKHSFFNNVCQ